MTIDEVAHFASLRSKKPTLWIYGCSFSHPQHICHFYGDDALDKHWAEIVGKHFNMTVKYYSLPGSSVEYTARQIFKTQSRWKEGDKKIIGVTSPYRTLCYKESRNKVVTVRAHQTAMPDFDGVIPEVKDALNSYFIEVKDRYKHQFTNWWVEMFYHVKPDYLWSWYEWTKPEYSTIKQEIPGTHDTHWGIEGNRVFANKVIKEMSDPNYETVV